MVEDDENETIARESAGCMHGDWIAETSIAGVSVGRVWYYILLAV